MGTHRVSLLEQIGRLLSFSRFLVRFLFVYLAVSIANVFLIAWVTGATYSESSWIAYEIATGGDPFNFYNQLRPYWFLWIWILIFHVVSWLLVPILVGLSVTSITASWAERRAQLKKQLQTLLSELYTTHAGMSPSEAEKLAIEMLSSMEETF
jgi:hypothetical protein